MDHQRFDIVVAAMTTARSRRGILAVAGAVTLALRAAPAPEASARRQTKSKQCPKARKCGKSCCKNDQQCLGGICGVPCSFTTDDLGMVLNGSCVLTEDITIPAGVTLDGKSNTITLAGKRQSPPIISIGDGIGAVRHLTINARRLTGKCTTERNLITFDQSSGAVKNVSIRGLSCGAGIAADAGPTEQAVSISSVSIRSSGRWGIYLNGPDDGDSGRLNVSILASDLRGLGRATTRTGIYARSNVDLYATNLAITAADYGIDGRYDSTLYVENSTITGAGVGIMISKASETGTALTALGNTIVGPGTPSTAGIYVDTPATANLQDNSINNYFSRRDADPACGIRIAPGASGGSMVTNVFPSPGNREDICI